METGPAGVVAAPVVPLPVAVEAMSVVVPTAVLSVAAAVKAGTDAVLEDGTVKASIFVRVARAHITAIW